MFKHNKNLGQHFLNNSDVIRSIVSSANITNKHVLEIGPGEGVLTLELLQQALSVTSIELDNRLIGSLEKIKQTHSNFNYIIGNALKLSPLQPPLQQLLQQPLILVANLPYNIGTQIFLNYLHFTGHCEYMILMLQLEVAKRITATQEDSNYGRLSIISNLLAKCELLFEVDKESFTPIPKVQSAVVKITPYAQPKYNVNLETLKKVTNLAFSGKRKTIKNSLKLLELNLETININTNSRAENLSLEEYCNIANYLDKNTTGNQ